jgi:hypothetical protein
MNSNVKLGGGALLVSVVSLIVLLYINSFGVSGSLDGVPVLSVGPPDEMTRREFDEYSQQADRLFEERIKKAKEMESNRIGTFFFLETRAIAFPFLLAFWFLLFYKISLVTKKNYASVLALPIVFCVLNLFGIIEVLAIVVSYFFSLKLKKLIDF